jgi:hypothetical protein
MSDIFAISGANYARGDIFNTSRMLEVTSLTSSPVTSGDYYTLSRKINRYNILPENTDKILSVTLQNVTGVALPLGSIVLCNVNMNNATTLYSNIVTVTVSVASTVTTSYVHQYPQADSSDDTIGRYSSSLQYSSLDVGIIKCIPVLVDTNATKTYSIPANGYITIDTNLTGQSGLAYAGLWIGDLYVPQSGFQRGNSISLNSKSNNLELENGDVIREGINYRRSLNFSFKGGNNKDREYFMYNLANKEKYFVSGFTPNNGIWCNMYGVTSYDKDATVRWLDNTGVMQLDSAFSMSPKLYDMYEYSMKFKDII